MLWNKFLHLYIKVQRSFYFRIYLYLIVSGLFLAFIFAFVETEKQYSFSFKHQQRLFDQIEDEYLSKFAKQIHYKKYEEISDLLENILATRDAISLKLVTTYGDQIILKKGSSSSLPHKKQFKIFYHDSQSNEYLGEITVQLNLETRLNFYLIHFINFLLLNCWQLFVSICIFVLILHITLLRHLKHIIANLQKVEVNDNDLIQDKMLPHYKYQDELAFLGETIDLLLIRIKDDFTNLKKSELTKGRAEEEVRVLNDILENKVKERTADLEVANNELRSFAHIISHDLKGPLRGIATISTWLYQDYQEKLDGHAQEQLKLLEQKARHIYGLVDRLLEYSKSETAYDVLFEKMNLDEILKRIADELKLSSESLTVSAPFNAIPRIKLSRYQLYRIFLNLASNAIKFNTSSRPKIEIGFLEFEKHFQFYVKDNGPGIKPEYHHKVFEVFQTLDNAPTGTGIGLSIVQRLVKGAGGDVWIESNGQSGTIVKFTVKKALLGT